MPPLKQVVKDRALPVGLIALLAVGWAMAVLRIGPMDEPAQAGSQADVAGGQYLAGISTSPVAPYYVPPSVASPVSAYYVQPPPQAAAAPEPSAVPVATPGSAVAPPAVAAASAAPLASAAASSARVELRSFGSSALGRGMPYFIYLPAGYDTSPSLRYPALYLLHGIGGGFGRENGTNLEWYGYGITGAADHLTALGTIGPVLIVLPQGDQSFWMDAANGGPKYGAYVAQDLVSEVDTHFRTLADGDHRAIGGLSMGGFGALELAMLYPNTFGTAGSHSASLYQYVNPPAFFGDEAYFDAHDPVHLLHAQGDVARRLKLWLDVADNDALWKKGNEDLHAQMLQDGIPHEWHEWPGEHNGVYWNAHLEDYLRFYDAGFKGGQVAPVRAQ